MVDFRQVATFIGGMWCMNRVTTASSIESTTHTSTHTRTHTHTYTEPKWRKITTKSKQQRTMQEEPNHRCKHFASVIQSNTLYIASWSWICYSVSGRFRLLARPRLDVCACVRVMYEFAQELHSVIILPCKSKYLSGHMDDKENAW